MDLWTLPSTPMDGCPPAPIRSLICDAIQRIVRAVLAGTESSLDCVPVDESGRYEIYVQSFPEPHGATRISTGGGQYAQWSPDGRELFYVSSDFDLMAVTVKLGPDSVAPSSPIKMFRLDAEDIGLSPYEVTPDGQRFLIRSAPPQAAKPLTVIVNWPALLKKNGSQ